MLLPKPNKPASKKPRVQCCGFGEISVCEVCGKTQTENCPTCGESHDWVSGAIFTPIDKGWSIGGVKSWKVNPYEGFECCNECADKYFREIPFKWGNESESDYRARVAKAETR